MSSEARAADQEEVPEGHHPVLHLAWKRDSGVIGWFTAVNHKQIGLRFIVTGLVFLIAGGILALLMRTQLIAADNTLLGAEGFNEAFTMHGTTMMFLFAVPILEGFAMYLLPLMLGTRDAPFPRLNALGYWAYLFGGLIVFSSFLFADAPSEGWFVYVPLSGPEFSPGAGMDFWLLGITFVEISAIIGAIELLVLFFSRRAPGMTIDRVPIFAWAVVVMSGMILFAFPALVTGSIMLEAERVLGTRFFDPGAGGDPLLWQHLFWFFGHPEVYIMLIPAIGVVSTVIPVFSRRPLAAYPWVVAALLAIGLISFGLWVHHMFTTGLSLVGLSIFAAASFLIAIPSGVQVFAWLATMWRGRPSFETPMLFIAGFLFVFVLGGVTGVMVAAVPFDWQVHDSYFIVAHFHYVLIGGVLFPIFAGLYHWFPKWSGRMMSEAMGRWSFWLMLIGFNVSFFPQHILGLQGMPRRVYTYRDVDGWQTLNLISSIGAYVIAIGVAVTLINLALSWRRGREAGRNPWGAGSLEWATESPPPTYNFRHLPVVDGADPLWRDSDPLKEDPEVERLVEELAQPGEPLREVFETRPIDARPIAVVHLPGPSPWPILTALAIAAVLIGALAGLGWLIAVSAGAMVALTVAWALDTVSAKSEVAVERSVPIRHAGTGWWGTVISLAPLAAMTGALAFGYLMLASGAEAWPAEGRGEPPLPLALGSLALVAASLAAVRVAIARIGRDRSALISILLIGASALSAAGTVAIVLWLGQMNVDATVDAYSSIVVALAASAILVGAMATIALAVVAWQAGRAEPDQEPTVSIRVVGAMVAYFLLVAAVAIAVITVGARAF